MTEWKLRVNGREETVDVSAEMPLLWVLRDLLGLTGTKYSCGIGVCRACAVHLDGAAVPSCVIPVGEVAGRAITTIEGLGEGLGHGLGEGLGEGLDDGPSQGPGTEPGAGALHPVQRAWREASVSQCGYCQPGQIMTAAALLARNPSPTDDEIDEAMGGVLCRCGTYPRIRRAIHLAARMQRR